VTCLIYDDAHLIFRKLSFQNTLQHAATRCDALQHTTPTSSSGNLFLKIHCDAIVELWLVAPEVSRSVSQCVAVCRSVSQCVTTCCSKSTASQSSVCCGMVRCVAVCCNVLQRVAAWCSVVQCVAECCSKSTTVQLSKFRGICPTYTWQHE